MSISDPGPGSSHAVGVFGVRLGLRAHLIRPLSLTVLKLAGQLANAHATYDK
jgi:hypothetical protein